jgi:hypothetical protein
MSAGEDRGKDRERNHGERAARGNRERAAQIDPQPNEDKVHDLLRQVVERRHADLLELVDVLDTRPLTDDEREELRGVIADELVEDELDAQDEPTPRGLLLEEVIDWLGHR